MTTSASYRPGDWFGIFGAHATVVLPPSEKSRVARIWALVDEGAGFDEVLDALISDGLRDLPGFVLVSDDDGETKVVIRGAARAEFTTGVDAEPVVVEGSSVTTWQERSLRDLASMRIDVADAAGQADLAISEGLVRISRIDRPAVAASQVTSHDDADQTGDDLTPVSPAVTDETDYSPNAPVPPLEPPRVEDHTPTPAGNWDLAALALEPHGDSEQPADAEEEAESAPHSQVTRLTFSTGDVVEVGHVVLVGRAPDASRVSVATSEPPRLVTVPSPHQEISSTHVEFRPGSGEDAAGVVVTDLGSTNGTVVQRPGLPPEDLRPGVPVPLAPGFVVDLGDGVTILVEDA